MQVREDTDWQGRARKWYAGAEDITSGSNLLQLAAAPAGADDLPFTSFSSNCEILLLKLICAFSPVPSLTQTDALTLLLCWNGVSLHYYCVFLVLHHARISTLLCTLCFDTFYNATVYNGLCVILPWQFRLTKAWLQSEVHKKDVVGLLKQITKQSKAFPRERPAEDKGRNIYAITKGHWKCVFWINTHLQYASTIAFAVSQRSARMEINDAALLENINQSISDFVKSFLSLWPSGARHLHGFITIHCNV